MDLLLYLGGPFLLHLVQKHGARQSRGEVETGSLRAENWIVPKGKEKEEAACKFSAE